MSDSHSLKQALLPGLDEKHSAMTDLVSTNAREFLPELDDKYSLIEDLPSREHPSPVVLKPNTPVSTDVIVSRPIELSEIVIDTAESSDRGRKSGRGPRETSTYVESLREQQREIEIAISILKSAQRKKENSQCRTNWGLRLAYLSIMITSLVHIIWVVLRRNHIDSELKNTNYSGTCVPNWKPISPYNISHACQGMLDQEGNYCSDLSQFGPPPMLVPGVFECEDGGGKFVNFYNPCSSLITDYCNVENIFGTSLNWTNDVITAALTGGLVPLYLLYKSFSNCRSRGQSISPMNAQKVRNIADKYYVDGVLDEGVSDYSFSIEALEEHLDALSKRMGYCEFIFESGEKHRLAIIDAIPCFIPGNTLTSEPKLFNTIFKYATVCPEVMETRIVEKSRVIFEAGKLNRNPLDENPLTLFFHRLRNEAVVDKRHDAKGNPYHLFRNHDKVIKDKQEGGSAYNARKVLMNIYQFAGFVPVPNRK